MYIHIDGNTSSQAYFDDGGIRAHINQPVVKPGDGIYICLLEVFGGRFENTRDNEKTHTTHTRVDSQLCVYSNCRKAGYDRG
jgi:hypothetical protein